MATGIPKTQSKKARKIPVPKYGRNSHNFELTYKEKLKEDEILALPRTSIKARFSIILHPEITWRNRLYYGDNLGIMLKLLADPDVCGKVTLIYIDPPFATKSIFQSRNLSDAYDDLLSNSQYIEFLRKRLVVAKHLLSPMGSIYLHLDENMAFPLKIIMDEVFGTTNYRNWITRKKCNKKNYTRKTYGNISDFILFYSKSARYIWNRPFEPWTRENFPKEYHYIEEGTNRRFMKVPLHAPGVRHGETGKMWRGMLPPPGKHWQYTPQKLDALDKKGQIYWSQSGNPRRKIYLDQSEGIPVQDIWLDFKDAHNQNIPITGYPTEKNLLLLKRIVLSSSRPGDLVMDFFAGSGTTLIAAELSDRRWVGIDSSLEAHMAAIKRFANGSERMGDYVTNKQPRKEVECLKQGTLFGSGSDEETQREEGKTKSKSGQLLKSNIDFFSSEDIETELSAKAIEYWKNLFKK